MSQFKREYSRLFGQPPMRDIKALRERSQRHATAVATTRMVADTENQLPDLAFRRTYAGIES